MSEQERLLGRLDEKLDIILENPDGWGGVDALEPLVILLLILRADLTIPRLSHADVMRRYKKFLTTRIKPGAGDIRERLGKETTSKEMATVLREHVMAVRTRHRATDLAGTFPRFGTVEFGAPY